MVNEVIFLGFRGNDRPPPGSVPRPDSCVSDVIHFWRFLARENFPELRKFDRS